MENDLASKSKFLSLVLRHQPELIGISIDANGWANLHDLVRLADEKGFHITVDDIFVIVSSCKKQRFSLDSSAQKIRANQGHSIAVDLEFVPLRPPIILYHGTAVRFLSSIQQSGLIRGSRRHVHLSQDINTAEAVGVRHGSPLVLTVSAEDMWRDGYVFYKSKNGVWLTDHVPVSYITLPA